jgi:hypothetical protein
MMYSKSHTLVFGFHGCDKSLVESIINCQDEMKPSKNGYDWLGFGIYFWENDVSRALEWAQHLKANPGVYSQKINEPAVLGAIIDLGYCLDLLNYRFLSEDIDFAYQTLKDSYSVSGDIMPTNSGGPDKLLRPLDCLVLETLHDYNKSQGRPAFDTVRGAFLEGEEPYPTAGFKQKNHIQICVRNPNCIKGYFIPREPDTSYLIP